MEFFNTSFSVDLSKSIVAHLVHQAVQQNGGSVLVNPEFALGSVVVPFLDVSTLVCAAANAHHPQELVDV